jgi:ABC-type polysaccharide/polyol phosphate transport system ATPase subunit
MVVVSHNASIVREFCSRAVWLDGGETRMEGEVNRVLDAYLGGNL